MTERNINTRKIQKHCATSDRKLQPQNLSIQCFKNILCIIYFCPKAIGSRLFFLCVILCWLGSKRVVEVSWLAKQLKIWLNKYADLELNGFKNHHKLSFLVPFFNFFQKKKCNFLQGCGYNPINEMQPYLNIYKTQPLGGDIRHKTSYCYNIL